MQEIYDVLTKETILLEKGSVMELSRKLGVDYTGFYHLIKRGGHFMGRYILPKDKDKIFTLVDLDTGKEYDCITNRTIFLHFGLPDNDNENKYVSRIKRGKQHIGSICNRILYLKSNGYPKISRTDMKNKSQKVSERKIEVKIKKKIYSILLNRIHSALNSTGNKKLTHTETLISCKILFLIGYLESKFTNGMTWENHGEWHIDHIKPCKGFDLFSLEQQKECFHYTNLRPLWATKEIAIKYGEAENYVGNLNRKKDGSN